MQKNDLKYYSQFKKHKLMIVAQTRNVVQNLGTCHLVMQNF